MAATNIDITVEGRDIILPDDYERPSTNDVQTCTVTWSITGLLADMPNKRVTFDSRTGRITQDYADVMTIPQEVARANSVYLTVTGYNAENVEVARTHKMRYPVELNPCGADEGVTPSAATLDVVSRVDALAETLANGETARETAYTEHMTEWTQAVNTEVAKAATATAQSESATKSATAAADKAQTATTAAESAAKSANDASNVANTAATAANGAAKAANSSASAADTSTAKADTATLKANASAAKADTAAANADTATANATAAATSATNAASDIASRVKAGEFNGAPFSVTYTPASIADMEAITTAKQGEFACILSDVEDPDNSKLYMYGDGKWNYITDMSGATGLQGPQGVQGVSFVSSSVDGTKVYVTRYDPATKQTTTTEIGDFAVPIEAAVDSYVDSKFVVVDAMPTEPVDGLIYMVRE